MEEGDEEREEERANITSGHRPFPFASVDVEAGEAVPATACGAAAAGCLTNGLAAGHLSLINVDIIATSKPEQLVPEEESSEGGKVQRTG